MSTFKTRNDAMLEQMTPFLVAIPAHWARLDRCPLGLPIPVPAASAR